MLCYILNENAIQRKPFQPFFYLGKGLNLVDFTGNSTQLYNLLEKQMAVIPDLMKAVQSAMLQPNKVFI